MRSPPVPRFGKQKETPGAGAGEAEKGEEAKAVATVPWPGDAIGQITALCALVASGPVTVGRFSGVKKEIVQRHLETLAILGELHAMGDGHYAAPVVVG